ncbi:MAG: glycoside hydrolase family 127 protein [Lachnospiraceae bacterium]|nr:glycoside hydrolase family 127 protein [Lachnospiraceae bacterium]
MITDNRRSENCRVSGLPFGTVRLNGGFLKEVEERCMKYTVPQLKRMFDDKDISHAVENFRICAGEAEGAFGGSVFCDGDFYKWLESAVYTAYTLQDTKLQEEIEHYVDLIGRSQQEDGYLSTKQILGERDGSAKRNSDINDFEVYNMGHLFTAACVHYRLSGRDGLLEVAKAAAGYLEKLYDESEKAGEVRTTVCPSHYMGLVELYRTTGEKRFLELAKKAIILRDSVKNGLDDNQDRIPLKQHTKIIGHAVRSNYLYAGLADLCAEISEPEYEKVLSFVWNDLVTKKLYITGGCGALYNGASPYGNFFDHQLVHQAYGYAYQLPNVTAYNETCASVGLVMWAYRMFLLNQEAKYFDVLEQAFYNVNLASVSLDGLRFFYENMLRRTKSLDYELIWPLTRTEYLISYCCPPNIARLLCECREYLYLTDREEGVYTGLYAQSDASVTLSSGNEIRILQETEYPYEGEVAFKITASAPFSLYLRIPGWCEKGRIVFDQGLTGEESYFREAGGTYREVQVPAGETRFTLYLTMPVRLMKAHPMVEEDTAQLAVCRGPLVYCVEGCDVEADSLSELYILPRPSFREKYDQIGGVRVLTLSCAGTRLRDTSCTAGDGEKLYTVWREDSLERKQVPVTFIPYFAWDNRGFGEMKIWLPLYSQQ